MHVDSLERKSFECRVLEEVGGNFNTCSDIFIRNIVSLAVNVECREWSGVIFGVSSDVYDSPSKRPYWVVVLFAVDLLIDAHSLPTILLIIQL